MNPKRSTLALFALLCWPAAAAPAQEDTSLPRDIQRRVKEETDLTVRRLHLMLRALAFHKLEGAEESGILRDIAGELSTLSREKMQEVLSRLEAAARTPDEGKSRAEVDGAYARHREILDALNRLLQRYDAVRDLQQASERLEKLSRDQLELFLQALEYAREAKLMASLDEKKSQELELRKRLDRSVETGLQRLSDDQGDLQRNLAAMLEQIRALREGLPPDQRERAARAEEMVRERLLLSALEEASRKMRQRGDPGQRAAQAKAAGFLQWKAAGDLKELSRSLRSPLEDLEALREARAILERALDRQLLLQGDVSAPPLTREREFLERRARELGDRQARVEFDVRDARVLLKPRSPAVSDRIVPAEAAMRESQDALRDQASAPALEAQNRAVEILRRVLKDLETLIAEAQRSKDDPVTALQEAVDRLDRIIQEQKEVRQKTEEMEARKETERLPELVQKQDELRARTQELRQDPSTDRPQTQKSLDQAARHMDRAAGAMEEKKAPEAKTQEDRAIQELEQARADLQKALEEAQMAQDQALPSAAQQIAKAIEQAQAAQGQAQEASRQMGAQQPSLAQMQQQVADQAGAQGLQASHPAGEAAQALREGNLAQAVRKQEQALGQLQQAAAHAPGQESGQPQGQEAGSPQGQESGSPSGHPSAAQLARTQRQLLEATKALMESQASTAEAQAAVGQAQALAPSSVQAPLGQAAGHLRQASSQLHQGQAAEAGQSQGQAVEALTQALDALNAQLEAMGMPAVQPGQPAAATASGRHPSTEAGQGQGEQGQGQGQEPGQGQGQGQPGQGAAQAPGQGQGQQGQSLEVNQPRGTGNRVPDGTLKNAPSQLREVKGGDSFLYLPPRQRDLIRQALSEGLPPEYAAMIQQYYVNLAHGRSAATPAVTEKAK